MKQKRKRCVISGHRTDISHKIWNQFHPDDPVVFGDGYDIHHTNGDHNDNSKNNQEKMLHGKHLSLTHLGRIRTEEWKKNMSIAHIGQKSRNKAVIAKNTEYSSGVEAAKALGVCGATIIHRIKTNKGGYLYA